MRFNQLSLQCWTTLLVLVFLMSTGLSAQETSETPSEGDGAMAEESSQSEPPPAIIHFTSVGYIDSNLTANLYYRFGNQYESIRIATASRGQDRPFSPRKEFTIYRKSRGPDGTDVMTPVLTRPMPDNSDSYIVFFAQVGDTLGMLPFDDSLRAHPRNSVRFHNLSNKDLKGFVNGVTIELAPNQTLLLPVDVENFTHLNIDLRAKDERGIWRPSYQRSSQVIPNMRMNIIAGNRPMQNAKRAHVLLTYRLIQHMPPEAQE